MRKWTESSITEESKKYKTRTHFLKGSSGAYDACMSRHKGLIDVLFPDTEKPWTKEELIQEAKKYKYKIDFVKGNLSAYRSIQKRYRYLLDELFENKRPSWDMGSVMEVIKKCRNIFEMQVKYSGAYKWARVNSPSMIKIFLGQSKRKNIRDTVYIWEVEDGTGIYKVGVTSSVAIKNRIDKVKNAGEFKSAKIIIMSVVGVEQASGIERLLKLTGSMVSFGKQFDGFTEFRKWTPSELEYAVSMISVFTKEYINEPQINKG